MQPMKHLSGLREIADQYDAIYCDVWGVLHNGRKAFAAASEALVAFRKLGGRVILLTNAPVPKEQVLRYFEPLGVSDKAYDDCVSSGDATRFLLQKYQGKKVWILGIDEGWEHDRYLYEGLDITLTQKPEEADIGLLVGLRDPRQDHPNDYKEEFSALAQTRLNLICANPDIQVRIGDRLYWCAGALAKIYEQEGGSVLYPGKPHPAIYDHAYSKLETLGLTPSVSRILAIGDGPDTDIRGANAQALDVLYVGTGLAEHSQADFLVEAERIMTEKHVHSNYAQAYLKW